MIPESKLEEIRGYLRKAENPLFFYDDDPDGLCSYLLLRKWIDKGKGVIVKSRPSLNVSFLRKVEELKPDYIFVLDKPDIEQEFIDKVNVPLIWLDHHPLLKRKGVHHYNPLQDDPKDSKPVTYYAYKITEENLWLATIGTLADYYLPSFFKEFKKKYADLTENKTKLDDLNFSTILGDLIKIFSFILKGKTSDVNKRVNVLLKIESPYEILNKETPKGKFIFNQTNKYKKEYEGLLNKALSQKPDKDLFIFRYPSTKNSYTGLLANELHYHFKDKFVVVARQKDNDMRMSIRYHKPIKDLLKKATFSMESTFGGHDLACGASVKEKDFNSFIDNLKKVVK